MRDKGVSNIDIKLDAAEVQVLPELLTIYPASGGDLRAREGNVAGVEEANEVPPMERGRV